MSYVYPANDYDQRERLLTLLGSFWETTYEGNELVEQLVYAIGRIGSQSQLDFQEMVDCVDRHQIPVYHTDQWYGLKLTLSQMNGVLTSLAHYDEGRNYDQGDNYDLPIASQEFAFPLPDDLIAVNLIASSPGPATKFWLAGVDFAIDRRFTPPVIRFHENPFDDPTLTPESIFTSGVAADQELVLWLQRGQFDRRYLDQHAGYLLHSKAPSSANYRQLLNALLDAIVGGPADRQLFDALTALTGLPLAKHEGEIVELVATEGDHRVVITDQEVYAFSLEAVAAVAEGETLRLGQAITDALEVRFLVNGETPTDIPGLAMDQAYLQIGTQGELIFPNQEVAVEVTSDADGFTRVEFPLQGFVADQTLFWNTVHARGRASGTTLAHLLDRRANPVGEPTAGSLPAKVNPMAFLVQNLLRFHTVLVRYRLEATGDDAAGFALGRLLSWLVPPWSALIMVIELELGTETVTMLGGSAGGGGGGQTTYQTSLTTLVTSSVTEVVQGPAHVHEGIRIKRLVGLC